MVVDGIESGTLIRATIIGCILVNGVIAANRAIVAIMIGQDDHRVAHNGNRVDITRAAHHLVVAGNRLGSLVDGNIAVIDCHIGDTVSKRDVIDGLTGITGEHVIFECVIADIHHNVFQLADIINGTRVVDDINVAVEISDKQQLILPIVENLRNLIIRQQVLPVQGNGRRRGLVKLEKATTVQVIDFVTCVINILNLGGQIVVMNFPGTGTGCNSGHHQQQNKKKMFF